MRSSLKIVVLGLVVGLVAGGAMAQECTSSPLQVALIAGQNFYAGTVTVALSGAQVCVTYETVGGWEITATHLAVATSLEGIPQTKGGNPQPGQFPYSATHTPPVTTFTYCVPNPGDGSQPLYVATHASVQQVGSSGAIVQRQTAWSGPYGFPGKNWATYLVFFPCQID
jgi:hypothetical protein